MRIGFSNYTPQSTSFKGLFEIKNCKGQTTWVNTDHLVSYEPNKDKDCPVIYTTNRTITLPKDTPKNKVLKLFAVAAGAKDRVIKENEVPL